MKTDFVEIVPIEGQTGCGSHRLFKRKLLLVERTGACYNIKLGLISVPSAREVQYVGAFGTLRFGTPFSSGETVKAWYKL